MPKWEEAPIVDDGAKQAARWQSAPIIKTQKDGGDRGVLPFLNRGIASTLGAPVDVVNLGLSQIGIGSEEPFLGSRSIERGMSAIGVDLPEDDQKPETLGEYVGRGVGEAAGVLVPFGGAAKVAQGARSAVARGVGETLTRPFVRTPVRAAAAETAAGAGAGSGAHIAEETDPEDETTRVLAELVGGASAALGPGAAIGATKAIAKRLPITGTVIRGARAALFPFTEAGGVVRASRRIRDLAGDPEAIARALEDPSIGNLTPAQQSGSDRLMALERAVLDADVSLDDQFKRRTAESARQLKEAIREPATDASAIDAQRFIARRQDYLLDLLDQRVTQAAEMAEQRIAKVTPKRRASESSSIVRDEIEAALSAARKQERQLWQAIPEEVLVPTKKAQAAYARLLEDLPRAQRDDMPEKARRFLDQESNERLTDTDTIKEVHGLYSAMREQSRHARAAGKFNEARIADDIAEAILVDLGAKTDTQTAVGRMINDARGFSAALNEKFRRGAVGRILGYAREGGAAVPAETTLDVTIGRGGTKAAVSTDDLRRAVDGSSGEADVAMVDYLRLRFSDYAIRNGKLEPRRAQEFLRNNDELLDRFPDLKKQIQEAEQAQVFAERTSRDSGGRAKALQNPRQSRAAEFLNAPLDQEFDTIIKSRSPREAAREIKRQASKDKTGKALVGLKGAVFDYLIKRSKTTDFDEMGQSVLSGRKMQNVLGDARARAAMTEILSKDEFRRVERIIRELRNVETSQRRLPSVGGVISDTPATIISLLGRTFAARAGAQAGKGTSGASLLTAQFASQRMKNFLKNITNDQAEALIRDAITDKELFRSLLLGVDVPKNARQVENRIIEWLEGYVGVQVGEASGLDEQRRKTFNGEGGHP